MSPPSFPCASQLRFLLGPMLGPGSTPLIEIVVLQVLKSCIEQRQFHYTL